MDYRSSVYNIFFDHNSNHYVYNTLSTAILELDDALYTSLIKSAIHDIHPEYIKPLLDEHILTEATNDEKKEYLYFYNDTRFNTSSHSFYLTLIPSYRCNLACPYCYEGQEKTSSVISMENVDRILAFFEKQILKDKAITRAIVRFYGGEPLLNTDILSYFARETTRIAQKHGLPILYDMPSNFTYVTEEALETIKKYSIQTQISIDGIKTCHDSRRIMKDGSGTYERILRNLKRACDLGLKDLLTIRLNIDSNNLETAEQCLNEIKPYAGYAYFGILDSYAGKNDAFSKNCVECTSYSRIITQKLNMALYNSGLATVTPFGKATPCSLCSNNKWYVDDQMNVYKCELLVNDPSTCVGKISSEADFIPNAHFYEQMNVTPEKYTECLGCTLLPICAGGCAAKKYIAGKRGDGKLHERNCEQSVEDVIEYVKFYIDHQD